MLRKIGLEPIDRSAVLSVQFDLHESMETQARDLRPIWRVEYGGSGSAEPCQALLITDGELCTPVNRLLELIDQGYRVVFH